MEDNKKELLIKSFEITVGVIVGYFAFISSPSQTSIEGLLSISIGLLTTIVIGTIVESYRQSQNANNILVQLSRLMRVISETQKENINLIQVLHYGVVTWSRDQIPTVWLEFLWKVEAKYFATSYISPNEGWDQAYTVLGLEIQKAKVKVNDADIRRVFIVDSEAELAELQKAVFGQQQVGIKVRYILRKEIESKSMLQVWAEKLETLDFVLIDSNYTILTILDKNRRIRHGQLLLDKSKCDMYMRFYTSLFAEAKELSYYEAPRTN